MSKHLKTTAECDTSWAKLLVQIYKAHWKASKPRGWRVPVSKEHSDVSIIGVSSNAHVVSTLFSTEGFQREGYTVWDMTTNLLRLRHSISTSGSEDYAEEYSAKLNHFYALLAQQDRTWTSSAGFWSSTRIGNAGLLPAQSWRYYN